MSKRLRMDEVLSSVKATGAQVISAAMKFILPVSVAEGVALVYPEGTEHAGKPFMNYKGELKYPEGAEARGFVFMNKKDNSWQGCRTDGSAIIILNEVTHQQSKQLYDKVTELGGDPRKFTLSQVTEFLDFAATLGLVDQYDSDTAFAEKNFTSVVAREGDDPHFGWKKRDARDICRAVYVSGEFEYLGDATASAQQFEDGGVLIMQGDKVRGCQSDVFERTYLFANGEKIGDASALPSYKS